MSGMKLAALIVMTVAGCAEEPDRASGAAPGGGKADDPTAEEGFTASLPGWGRYIVLDKLHDIVPVYLAETRKVLEQIDALPAGTVDETTELDEVPVDDLFASGNDALGAVLDEASFDGGREDHDVAWLRGSAEGLAALADDVAQMRVDGSNPPAFDEHLTNTHVWRGDDGDIEISVGIAAVSRFYCNLDVRIVDSEDDGFYVEASESCD